LPDFDDGVHALVAGALERLEQELAVEGVAYRNPQRARREVRRRRELGVERRGGDDDHHRLVGGEPPADDGALGVGLPLPPPAPEPGLGLGELERRRTEEFQILGPAVGVGHGLHENHRGPRVRLDELRDGQGAGGARQPGDAQADRSLGEGLRQGVKGRPLSQHRTNNPTLPRHRRRFGATARGSG